MLDKIEKILSLVEKPARYCGNEFGAVIKNDDSLVKYCMAFPDTYEVGMSHLGSKILYGLVNDRQDALAERVFAPWLDMDEKLRENNIPLYSLETYRPLKEFDIIGFTLQYEMSYTNILNMLNLSNIEIEQCKRTDDDPLIVVGGPCACNCEPIADLIDIAVIGDGEDTLNILIDEYKSWKLTNTGKDELFKTLLKYDGFYIPKFYTPFYNQDGTFSHMENENFAPKKIRRAIIENLDEAYFPTDVVVPFVQTVHDRMMLELFRGCTRGCRFCQAGFLYRPLRLRKKSTLVRQAMELYKNSGMEEISLTSLSTGDYPCLGDLLEDLLVLFKDDHVSLSLPSLRLDSFVKDYSAKVATVRKTGLTFAPEAGSQRLRDVINKGVTKENLVSSLKDAFESGWNKVKLYFMIGLPTETYEDLDAIVDLARLVAQTYYSVDKNVRTKGLRITIGTSTFVPKPFTPFQWCAQDEILTINEKQRYLKEQFNALKSVNFNYHGPQLSFLEAAFSKGDRKLFKVLKRAVELGCKFDGWSECFNYDAWMQAFNECGIDPAFYANRIRDKEEAFAYDHIDMIVEKEYLYQEYQRALSGSITTDCRNGCNGCFGEEDYETYCSV